MDSAKEAGFYLLFREAAFDVGYALCICLEQPRRFRQTPCTSRSHYL